MTDWQRGFVQGLSMGQKLPVMARQPTDVYIQNITSTPTELNLRPGDTGFLVFSIYPRNATIPKVECRSNDIQVIGVNRYLNEGLIFQYRAINPGSTTISVDAVDGGGATYTVNVNVFSAVSFNSLTLQTQQQTEADLFIQEGYVVFNYTPLDADGNNIRIKMHEPYSGADSPYIVENTPFDNIKRIKANLQSMNREDYLSTTAQQRFDWEATDGSGFTGSNVNIGISAAINQTLFGRSTGDSLTQNVSIRTGCECGIISNTRYQSLFGQRPSIEFIEGQDVISIDSQYVIKGLRAGTAKFTLTVGPKVTTYTVTVSDSYTGTTSGTNNFTVIDEYGQQQDNNVSGWYTLASNRYKIVPTAGYIRIDNIEVTDTSKADVDSNWWITPKAAGAMQFRVTGVRNPGSSEVAFTTTITVYVYASIVSCGTVTSNYLKEGVAVWAGCRTNTLYFNGINHNKIDAVFDPGQLSLIDSPLILNSAALATLTFNRDGKNGSQVTNHRPQIYVFRKLIAGTVTIKFQHHDFPDIYDEVEI